MGVRIYKLMYEREAVGYRLISEEDGIGVDFDYEVLPRVCKLIKVDPSYIKQVYAGDIQMWYNSATGLLEAKSPGDESSYLECPGEFMEFTLKKVKNNEAVNLKALIAYQWYLSNPLAVGTKVFVNDKSCLTVMSKGTCAFGTVNDDLTEHYRKTYNGKSRIVVWGEIPSEYVNIPVVAVPSARYWECFN